MKNRSLHGRHFAADIIWEPCVGRIFVTNTGDIYLCQDTADGSGLSEFGYKYAWGIGDDIEKPGDAVQNLTLLPEVPEYHRLFLKLLASRETTWDVDKTYWVLEKAFMEELSDFVGKLKNPGK